MSKFFLLIAVALSVSFECSINAQFEKAQEISLLEAALITRSTSSINGLEGFADDGVVMKVEDWTKLMKDFPKKQITTQIELRLRQAKVKINNNAEHLLYVNLMPHPQVNLYIINFEAQSYAYFTAGNVLYKHPIRLWVVNATIGKDALRSAIDGFMDDFLLELIKAQEAHEKNKKALADKKKSAAKPSSVTPSKK